MRSRDSENAEKALKPNPILYGVAASTYFSDSLLMTFLFPYVVVLGATFDQMGMIRSARNFFQSALQIGWAEVSERLSRKMLVAIGYLSSCCFIIAFLLIKDPSEILILVVAQAIFWSAAAPAWSSLLADYTTLRTRGRVLGKIGAVSYLSRVVAALIVALATYTEGEMTASSFFVPFALSAATALIGGALVIFVKEARVERPKIHRGSVILAPLLDKRFRIFLAVSGLHWFTMAYAWPLFPYVTVDIVHATVWQIAVISAVSGLFTSVLQPKAGSLVDKFGRKPVLAISRASFFLYPLLYTMARSWIHLLLINIILSFSMSAAMVSFSAYVMDSAPPGMRANYAAASNLIMGISTFIGSMTGGVITGYLSASLGAEQALFYGLITSAILRLFSSIGFLLIKETTRGE
ncbi:MFS transporter [Candidatus Bathyarchaeota archaeon]|nr:MFS transporter [Candidatus Bathyarchaeota archaeon]